MNHRIKTLCFPLCLALLLPLLGAQSKPPRVYKKRSPASALKAFQKVTDQPETVRRARVLSLGYVSSPEVTNVLVAELARARTASYRSAVVSALGRKKRKGALPPLLDLLDAETDFSRSYSLAYAIGRQGAAAVPELARRLESLGNDNSTYRMRNALLRGLGATKSAAAWPVLIKAAGEGEDRNRYQVLQELKKAPESAALTKLRVDCLDSTYDPLRFEALDQLAAAGYTDIKKAALAAYESQRKKGKSSFYVGRLVPVFAKLLDPETYPAYVWLAGNAYQSADASIKKVAKKVDSYDGFADWLLAAGLKSKVPAERLVSLRLLTHSKHAKVSAALLKLVTSTDPGVSLLAIRALGERGDKQAVPMLRRALKLRDSARQADALLGLHTLLKDESAWLAELRGMVKARSITQRALAMDLLAEQQAKDVLPQVYESFTHKAWQVRAAAYDFCRLVRSLDSVDPLIARVDVEKGRLREDCLDALKAITSYRLPTGARWRGWWKDAKPTFKMPTLEQALPQKKRKSGARTVSSFFDIPLVSSRVTFVMDISGSMSSPMGTLSASGKASNTRIEAAKRQLTRVVGELPKDAVFNMFVFESKVRDFQKKAKKATKKTKSDALEWVAKLRATGGTNIHDALEAAFKDQEIDTIYLLSDGSPSAGKITNPNDLADQVARWNKVRRLRIHTISIGSKSKLMERLAKESGGVYSQVN